MLSSVLWWFSNSPTNPLKLQRSLKPPGGSENAAEVRLCDFQDDVIRDVGLLCLAVSRTLVPKGDLLGQVGLDTHLGLNHGVPGTKTRGYVGWERHAKKDSRDTDRDSVFGSRDRSEHNSVPDEGRRDPQEKRRSAGRAGPCAAPAGTTGGGPLRSSPKDRCDSCLTAERPVPLAHTVLLPAGWMWSWGPGSLGRVKGQGCRDRASSRQADKQGSAAARSRLSCSRPAARSPVTLSWP